MSNKVIIRKMKYEDAQVISDAFAEQEWHDKPIDLYQKYFKLQESGERDILIAEVDGIFAGYLTISWESSFVEFRNRGIPEIVDFNVLERYQRLGIGTALMDEAERRIGMRSDEVGIGFGVTKDYGPAQILYIKRGYIPWGNGLTINGKPVNYGDKLVVGHDMVFHLVKTLKESNLENS